MRKPVKDALYFSPRERKGIFVLLTLIVLLAFAPNIIEALEKPDPPIDTSSLEEAYTQLQEQKKADSINRTVSYAAKYNQPKTVWKKGNTSEPVKTTGYRQKDWGKEKGRTTDENEHRPPAGVITPASATYPERDSEQGSTPASPKLVIDVNTATPEAWQQLKGIGPSYSKRIVKFREGLGGFHSIEQVGETFGLPPETFASIRSQLVISGGVRKINVGAAGEDALKAHPYISPAFAKQIINYRTKVEPISSDEIFLKLYFMDAEKLKQLKPYIEY